MSHKTLERLEYLETLGEPCALKGASTVRWGEVGVLGQPRPGLLPDSG